MDVEQSPTWVGIRIRHLNRRRMSACTCFSNCGRRGCPSMIHYTHIVTCRAVHYLSKNCRRRRLWRGKSGRRGVAMEILIIILILCPTIHLLFSDDVVVVLQDSSWVVHLRSLMLVSFLRCPLDDDKRRQAFRG